jgi:acyl-CoA synthetase (AMP-forming)/AMP-acid ligase II
MVFHPPRWAPKLPFDPPDTLPIQDFVLEEKYGRLPFDKSLDPYTCGISGKSYAARDQKRRTEQLARALAKGFGWGVNKGTEYDKVVGVFALNSVRILPLGTCFEIELHNADLCKIDIMTLNWAIHRLNGISSPANAAYSAEELMHQLKNSGSTALFTCLPLLSVAMEAASKAGIPKERIYICELPEQVLGGVKATHEFQTLSQLIEDGASLPALEPIEWEKGQGGRQTAFLCYSSGTSGLPVYSPEQHNGLLLANLDGCSRKVS